MDGNEIRLYFAGRESPELIKTEFRRSGHEAPSVCTRGRGSKVLYLAGVFRWAAPVKALAILLARAAMAERDRTRRYNRNLIGHRGSLAASLDSALSEQSLWLRDMFGAGDDGVAYACRFILRVNAERTRPGPVVLGLNTNVLKPKHIWLFWEDELLVCPEAIATLVASLEGRGPYSGCTTETVRWCDLALAS